MFCYINIFFVGMNIENIIFNKGIIKCRIWFIIDVDCVDFFYYIVDWDIIKKRYCVIFIIGK